MDGQIEIPDFDDEPSSDFGGFNASSSTSNPFGFSAPGAAGSSSAAAAATSSKTPWGATNFNNNNDFTSFNFNESASHLFGLPSNAAAAVGAPGPGGALNIHNSSNTLQQNASSSSLASLPFSFGGMGSHSRTRSLASNKAGGADHPLPLPPSSSSASVNTDVQANSPAQQHLAKRNGPSELALALIMDDFSHRAELKINDILSRSVDQELYLPRTLAEGVDPQFDRVLVSVAQLSKSIPNLVIDQLMRWRKDHLQGIDSDMARRLAVDATSATQVKSAVDKLNERKNLSSIYLLCRALTAVAEVVNTDLLANEFGAKLEEVVYNTIRKCNPQQLERSSNRRANMESYARLVGSLSAIRFQSVTDRFLKDLNYIPEGLTQNNEANIEHIVRCMRWVRLKVYPMEAFEDAAELLESMSRIFDAASGERIKRALAQTLNQMLEAIVLTASAEVNHPVWSTAMQVIHAKASDMVAKPRYVLAAMPLVVTSVSASPEPFVLANLNNCLNLCIAKLKDRQTRLGAFYGILQLLWAYLRRCHETHTGVSKRIEPIVKTIFPPGNKRVIYPPDVPPTMVAIIPHLVLQHHFELGRELLDSLLNPSPPISTDHWPPEVLCHERKHCAITALLYSLDAMENGKEPVMPPAPHVEGEAFIHPITLVNPVVGPLPEVLLARGGLRLMVDQASAAIARIAIACDKACEAFKVLDDRNVVFQGGASFQPYTPDRENHIQRRHGAFTVTYPRDKQPLFDLLRACLDSWPRLLANTEAVTDFRPADILIRCLLHIDIDISIAARKALERLSAQPGGHLYVRALTRSIVRPELVLRESILLQNANTVKLESLVGLWNGLVEILLQQIEAAVEASRKPAPFTGFGFKRPGLSEEKPAPMTDKSSPQDIYHLLVDIEATALVLAISQSALIRRRAVDALRLAMKLETALHEWNDGLEGEAFVDQEPRVLSVLQESGKGLLEELDEDAHSSSDRARIKHWKKQTGDHVLLRLAESDTLSDLPVWQRLVAPTFKTLLAASPTVMNLTRALLAERLVKGYGMASTAAGLVSGKSVAGPLSTRHGPLVSSAPSADLRFIIDYWKMHLGAVCALTMATPQSGRAYSSAMRDASDINSPADIVRAAIPFLASDEAAFREASIFGLGCIHLSGYKDLLQGLSQNVANLRAGMDLRHQRTGQGVKSHSSTRHTRTFASVARVYEKSSILMRDSELADAELGLISHCLEDMIKTIVQEQLPLDCRKAFAITLRNFAEQCGNRGIIKNWMSPQFLYDAFRYCEQWSFVKSHSHSSSKSSHNHSHSRSRSDEGGHDAGYDIFIPAVRAVAALCEQNAVTLKRYAAEPAAVDPPLPLRWAQNLFSFSHPGGYSCAKRAVGALINFNLEHKGFQDSVVQQCFNEPADLPLQQSTFSVVSGALIVEESIAIKPWSAIILALWKVGQPDLATRQRALDVLAVRLPEDQRTDIITSCQAAVYTRFIGDILDMRHRLCKVIAQAAIVDPRQAFLELAIRNLQNKDKQTRSRLQLLPIWLGELSLPAKIDKYSTDAALANVFLLTLTYWDTYPSELRAMWTSLISPAHPQNLQSVVHFLVDQSQLRGIKEFTRNSQRCLAALCEGEHDARILAILSELAQPSMSLITDDSQAIAEGKATNLEPMFPVKKRSMHLSTAQAAVLLASDALLTRLHTADPNVIRIIHVLLLQVDHTTTFIRFQSRDILQRAMTLLKKLDRLDQTSDPVELARSAEVEWSWTSFWDHDEEGTSPSTRRTVPNMERFIKDALQLLENKIPDARRLWGVIALEWAVSCPLRHMACRSFQSLRLLSPQIDQRMLSEMLSRLSETMADTSRSPDARLFTREILHTLVTVAEANETPIWELPQLWWSFLASATTTNEEEFTTCLLLGQAVLDRLSDDQSSIATVGSYQPEDWPPVISSLRDYITRGARSANTLHACWDFVQCLMRPSGASELTGAASMFHLAYAFTLQWGLDAMETSLFPPHFDSHCARLAQWADHLQEEGIARVCKSLGKNRFRTKEDFVREAASTMKEYFSLQDQLDTFVLYLGSLQNALVWMRERTLVLLKSFFHQVQLSQADVENLGSDQLAPLIRLLPTDMAPMALDVLSEHVPLHSGIWDGPGRRKGSGNRKDSGDASSQHQRSFSTGKACFGSSEPSGWSVGTPDEDAATTRSRLRQVVDTCETVSQASPSSSPLAFASEAPNLMDGTGDHTIADSGDTSTLAEMMNTLSSLATFWDATLEAAPSNRASQSVENAPRIAAVLSRSLRSQPSSSSHKSRRSSLSMTTIPELSSPSPTSIATGQSGASPFDEAFAESWDEGSGSLIVPDEPGQNSVVAGASGYFDNALGRDAAWDTPKGGEESAAATVGEASDAFSLPRTSSESVQSSRARPFGWTKQTGH